MCCDFFIMNKQAVAKKVVEYLQEIKALTFSFDPPFTFTSGLKSPVYLDNRLIMSYPEIREQFIQFQIKMIGKKIGFENFDVISGTATAAIPMAAWLSDRLNKPMVFVRSSKKGHGKENQIEGVFEKGQKVLVIEDHVSTGKSTIENIMAIREAGGIVKYAVANSTYNTKIAEKAFVDVRVEVFTLVEAKDIVEAAYEQGSIDKNQKELVEDWFIDPVSWGEKYSK